MIRLHNRFTMALMFLGLALSLCGPGRGASVGVHQDWKANLRAVAPRPRAIHQAQAAHIRSTPTYPGSPYTIEGLIARQALNPARFDRFHPIFGPLLAQDARLRAAYAAGQQVNGLFAPSAYLNYLLHRRSLLPARFDYYHPILGPLLAEDQRLRNLVRPIPPVILPPPLPTGGGGGTGGTNTGAGGVGGSSGGGGGVPEPSTFVLIALGAATLGARAAWKRRHAPA